MKYPIPTTVATTAPATPTKGAATITHKKHFMEK